MKTIRRSIILCAYGYGLWMASATNAWALEQHPGAGMTDSAQAATPSQPKASSPEMQAELARQQRDFALAPIKSSYDLAQFLSKRPPSDNPINQLAPRARERFLASLTFNENGLTGFSYEELREQLTAAQIYQVLSLFGAQRTLGKIPNVRVESDTDRKVMAASSRVAPRSAQSGDGNDLPMPDDHEDYRCDGGHTCGSSPRHICMSGC